MAGSHRVLVDTSVWIQFFRTPHAAEAHLLDTLLSLGSVATCAPIRVEVVSGALYPAQFQRLREMFNALVDLSLPTDLWPRVEETRFLLARRGHQVSLIDLIIAITAHTHAVSVWTFDEDFSQIRHIIPFQRFQVAHHR